MVAVQEFIECLQTAISAELAKPGNQGIDAKPLLDGLRSEAEPASEAHSEGLPTPDNLPDAARTAQAGPPQVRALADAFIKIAPGILWYQRPEPDFPDFMRGHANTFIVGPRGVQKRAKTIVGATWMAPGLQYPDHHHPPEELYIALSDGEWRQNEAPWQSPGLGGLVHNPGNVTHSMRSTSEPLLTIWCLWT